MAELLIRSKNNVNANFTGARERFLPKRGDVIAVVEDGENWGSNDLDINDFIIVKMPGEPRADYEYLMEEDVLVDRNGKPVLDSDDDEIFFRYRRHNFMDLLDVPVEQRGKQTMILSKSQLKFTDRRKPPE